MPRRRLAAMLSPACSMCRRSGSWSFSGVGTQIRTTSQSRRAVAFADTRSFERRSRSTTSSTSLTKDRAVLDRGHARGVDVDPDTSKAGPHRGDEHRQTHVAEAHDADARVLFAETSGEIRAPAPPLRALLGHRVQHRIGVLGNRGRMLERIRQDDERLRRDRGAEHRRLKGPVSGSALAIGCDGPHRRRGWIARGDRECSGSIVRHEASAAEGDGPRGTRRRCGLRRRVVVGCHGADDKGVVAQPRRTGRTGGT